MSVVGLDITREVAKGKGKGKRSQEKSKTMRSKQANLMPMENRVIFIALKLL